jgi:thioredoxin-like negative regulator of GroEL
MQVGKINAKELKSMLANDSGELVAVFVADWCGYSKSLMRELEGTTVGFKLCEVDISETEDKAWEDYNIDVVPTALLFRAGKEVARRACSFEGMRVKDLQALAAKRA